MRFFAAKKFSLLVRYVVYLFRNLLFFIKYYAHFVHESQYYKAVVGNNDLIDVLLFSYITMNIYIYDVEIRSHCANVSYRCMGLWEIRHKADKVTAGNSKRDMTQCTLLYDILNRLKSILITRYTARTLHYIVPR